MTTEQRLSLEITPALAMQLLGILKQIPLQTVQQKRDAAELQEAIEKALDGHDNAG